jgi:hypothetical protein
MTEIFQALDREGLLTAELKRLTIAGLLAEEAFETVAAGRDVHGEPVLQYVLELPLKPLTAEQAVAWLRLGWKAADAIENAGGDLLAWSAAMPAIEEAMPGILEPEVYPKERLPRFNRLVGTVVPLQYTPERLIEEGGELLGRGVHVSQLYAALRQEDPVPVEVLASNTRALFEVSEYERQAEHLAKADVYRLVLAGIPISNYEGFQKLGVEEVSEMVELAENGINSLLAGRFAREGVPQENWIAFRRELSPLAELRVVKWPTMYTALSLRKMLELFNEGVPAELVGEWSAAKNDSSAIRNVITEGEWIQLMRAGCSTAFLRQFSILLHKPDLTAAKPYVYTYEVDEEDGLVGGLLRLRKAGVDEEWARRYKVEVMGRKLLKPSDYIEAWRNNRSVVRNWRTSQV